MKQPYRQRFILILMIIFYSWLAISQECGFGANFQSHLDQNPNLLIELGQSGGNFNNLNPPDEYIIPVVVHVIHSGGPENISDEQVFRAIEILNEGFRGDYDPDHLDTKIRFQLAQTDPNGCATNGIVRVFREVEPCIFTGYQVPPNQGVQAFSISYWPKERYFNIWVVNCFDSPSFAALADYAFVNDPSNGIVSLHSWFGDTGTAFQVQPYLYRGTTIVHEAGHAFGLQHIWGPDLGFWTPTWYPCHLESEGETNGDFVTDTPPQGITVGFPCTPQINSCEIEALDRVDDMDNFMGYSQCIAKAEWF